MKNKLLPMGTRVAVRTRGYLPHWEVDESYYSITYRLADSLPKYVTHKLRAEYRAAKAALGQRISLAQQTRLAAWFHRRLDEFLDEGRGACHLKNPDVARCVIDTWHYFDRERYELIAWCVMPNHVHVIARIFVGGDLDSILHSWKSYTANRANESLGRAVNFGIASTSITASATRRTWHDASDT